MNATKFFKVSVDNGNTRNLKPKKVVKRPPMRTPYFPVYGTPLTNPAAAKKQEYQQAKQLLMNELATKIKDDAEKYREKYAMDGNPKKLFFLDTLLEAGNVKLAAKLKEASDKGLTHVTLTTDDLRSEFGDDAKTTAFSVAHTAKGTPLFRESTGGLPPPPLPPGAPPPLPPGAPLVEEDVLDDGMTQREDITDEDITGAPPSATVNFDDTDEKDDDDDRNFYNEPESMILQGDMDFLIDRTKAPIEPIKKSWSDYKTENKITVPFATTHAFHIDGPKGPVATSASKLFIKSRTTSYIYLDDYTKEVGYPSDIYKTDATQSNTVEEKIKTAIGACLASKEATPDSKNYLGKLKDYVDYIIAFRTEQREHEERKKSYDAEIQKIKDEYMPKIRAAKIKEGVKLDDIVAEEEVAADTSSDQPASAEEAADTLQSLVSALSGQPVEAKPPPTLQQLELLYAKQSGAIRGIMRVNGLEHVLNTNKAEALKMLKSKNSEDYDKVSEHRLERRAIEKQIKELYPQPAVVEPKPKPKKPEPQIGKGKVFFLGT